MTVKPGDWGLCLPQYDGSYVFLPAAHPVAGDMVIGYPLKNGGYYAVPMLPVLPGSSVLSLPYNGGYVSTNLASPLTFTVSTTVNYAPVNGWTVTTIQFDLLASEPVAAIDISIIQGGVTLGHVNPAGGAMHLAWTIYISHDPSMLPPNGYPLGLYDLSIQVTDDLGRVGTMAGEDVFEVRGATTITAPPISDVYGWAYLTRGSSGDGGKYILLYVPSASSGINIGEEYTYPHEYVSHVLWQTAVKIVPPALVSTHDGRGTTFYDLLLPSSAGQVVWAYAPEGGSQVIDTSVPSSVKLLAADWATGTNYLTNGGFESGAAGWTVLNGACLVQDENNVQYPISSPWWTAKAWDAADLWPEGTTVYEDPHPTLYVGTPNLGAPRSGSNCAYFVADGWVCTGHRVGYGTTIYRLFGSISQDFDATAAASPVFVSVWVRYSEIYSQDRGQAFGTFAIVFTDAAKTYQQILYASNAADLCHPASASSPPGTYVQIRAPLPEKAGTITIYYMEGGNITGRTILVDDVWIGTAPTA